MRFFYDYANLIFFFLYFPYTIDYLLRKLFIHFKTKATAAKPFIFIILLICILQILMICFGGAFLGTAPLTLKEWATVIVMALLIIPVDIARKLIVKRL